MFVWKWNKVDEKLWKENKNENFLVSLVRWEERKINSMTQVFTLQAHQKVLSKIERKLKGWKNWTLFLDKNAHVQLHMGLSKLLFFFFFHFSFQFSNRRIRLIYLFRSDISCNCFFFFFFNKILLQPNYKLVGPKTSMESSIACKWKSNLELRESLKL